MTRKADMLKPYRDDDAMAPGNEILQRRVRGQGAAVSMAEPRVLQNDRYDLAPIALR